MESLYPAHAEIDVFETIIRPDHFDFPGFVSCNNWKRLFGNVWILRGQY